MSQRLTRPFPNLWLSPRPFLYLWLSPRPFLDLWLSPLSLTLARALTRPMTKSLT